MGKTPTEHIDQASAQKTTGHRHRELIVSARRTIASGTTSVMVILTDKTVKGQGAFTLCRTALPIGIVWMRL